MDTLSTPPAEPAWLSQPLVIPEDIWNQMRSQVETHLPQEACGLLAGKGTQVSTVFPVQNRLHSPHHFLMEPDEQLQAFLEIERRGLELQAIYHSHPAGPLQPSSTDIEEAAYPDAAYLVWARAGELWQCKGFSIREKIVREIRLVII